MKTLEKSEMLERNKVGRVLTEEGILNQGMQWQRLASVFCELLTSPSSLVPEHCAAPTLLGLYVSHMVHLLIQMAFAQCCSVQTSCPTICRVLGVLGMHCMSDRLRSII